MNPDLLRKIPSVEKVLEHPAVEDINSRFPRWAVIRAVRQVLAGIRDDISKGGLTHEPDMGAIIAAVRTEVVQLSWPAMRRVINATGVVLHTNLGRAILSEVAADAAREAAMRYSSLEYDLDAGRRAERTAAVEGLLRQLVNCESAFVVNNNAAAVMLVLNTLCCGKKTLVSRGELVEIGGSFRLPEIMARSGTILVEVGTTNRTRLGDYEKALDESVAAVLTVHLSNFWMSGFVESVPRKDLVGLAKRSGIALVEDLGSGAVIDLASLGVAREPMPQDAIRDGADVVCFSGDKLLGGPQAGIILGRADLVERMKANPMARALRLDKMTLAALEATLRQYLEPETVAEKIPVLRMLSSSAESLEGRARLIRDSVAPKMSPGIEVAVERATSQVGGGSLPQTELETCAVSLASASVSAEDMASALRACDVPVVARICENKVLIDLRTVQPSEDQLLAQQLVAAFSGRSEQTERS